MADPLTLLALHFLLAHGPEIGADLAKPLPYAPEGPTLPEIGDAALLCYHPTARFLQAELLESPWSGGELWQAERSSLISIEYAGALTRQSYVLTVALIERGGNVRGVLLADSALVPASPLCSLNHWTAAK